MKVIKINYKKDYERLQKELEKLKVQIEEQKSYYDDQSRIHEDYIGELLIRQGTYEERIKNLEQETETSQKNETKVLLENKKLHEQLITLKASYKNIYNSLGGTKKQNNKLLRENGKLISKNEFLEFRLKYFKIKNEPTMKELQEYERTHMSPKKRKELEKVI